MHCYSDENLGGIERAFTSTFMVLWLCRELTLLSTRIDPKANLTNPSGMDSSQYLDLKPEWRREAC